MFPPRQSRQPLSWVIQESPTTLRMGWFLKPTCQFVSTSPQTVKTAQRPSWCQSRWTTRPLLSSRSGSVHRMWLRCLSLLSQEYMLILQVYFVIVLFTDMWLKLISTTLSLDDYCTLKVHTHVGACMISFLGINVKMLWLIILESLDIRYILIFSFAYACRFVLLMY